MTRSKKSIPYLAGLLVLFAAGITLFIRRQMAPPDPQEVKRALATLMKSPKWTAIYPPEELKAPPSKEVIQTRQKIMKSLEEVAQFDLNVIDEVEVQYFTINYEDPNSEDGIMSRLYLLNRYLFAVPKKGALKFGPTGGYIGDGSGDGGVILDAGAWPFVEDDAGRLHLRGWYYGFMGAANPVGEFRHFRKHYRLRTTR